VTSVLADPAVKDVVTRLVETTWITAQGMRLVDNEVPNIRRKKFFEWIWYTD